MDLNDSFTETLLRRSKVRKEYLNAKMNETSNQLRKKRAVLADENILDDSSKRQRLNNPEESEKENAFVEPVNVQDTFVPFKVASSARGLAALKKKHTADTTNEIKVTTDSIAQNKWEAHIISSTNKSQPSITQQSRLANLAGQINQWEEDCHQPTQASNNPSYSLTKINMSSACKIPSSNSNSIAIKLYYTNTPNDSHNLGMQTVSQLGKSGALCDSELSSSSIPFGLKTSNNNARSVMSVKPSLQDQAVKVFVENEKSGKLLAKPMTISTREGIKNSNFEKNVIVKDSMVSKMNDSKSAKQSQHSCEPNNSAEHTHFPLLARKAFFEKAATAPIIKSNETTFLPKLSVVQRAAMFEKTSNSNNKKPMGNLSLPKRIITPLFIKSSEDGEQRFQHEPCPKTVKKIDVQSSGFPIQVNVSTSQVKSDIPDTEEQNTNTYVEHQFKKRNAYSLPKNVPAAIISSPKEPENNSKQIIADSATNLGQKLESAILGNAKCVKDGAIDTVEKSEEKASQQNCGETADLQKQCSESNINDSQQRCVQKSITISEEAVVSSEMSKKQVSNLLNQWEKLSSTFVDPNPEKESSAKQRESISMDVHISEDEHSDCKSELEWESTEGESASEWEYIKGESLSEFSERKTTKFFKVDTKHDEKKFLRNEESISDCEIAESTKDSSAAYDKQKVVEQDALQHGTFSVSSVIHTSSFPTSDKDINCQNEQNWQQEVNDNPNQTDTCKSFSSETKNLKISQCQTIFNDQIMEPNKVKDSSEVQEMSIGRTSRSFESPLVHTVSFYRKQKQESIRSSPMPPLKRSFSSDEEEDPTQGIQKRIKLLQEEILRQQTVIGQTSQALNLCYATTEFSGSSEKIEAERLLLIATQKRLACMNEIQSLKFRGIKKGHATDGTGSLVITDLQLPLKQDFIASQLKGEMSNVHCFLCLIRQGAQVIVSQMVSTSDKITNGALCFPIDIKLQNLSPDFSVVFEVYTLQTSRENLSHDQKYHIRRDHSKIRLTPKGKKNESKLQRPAISSPGGPDAVRSSSFALIGHTRFTVQNSNKKCFTLDRVPFASPLEGILKVTLQLHTNHTTSHKGFLTLFEDVSGYGLWTRLWCSLDSYRLSYWKYPDDEQGKDPVGAIDLRECATGVVESVSRDECARPNTFRIVTERPVREEDKETLVSRTEGALTRTKHLLSADTKEERIDWCDKLNEALSNVRKWDAQVHMQ